MIDPQILKMRQEIGESDAKRDAGLTIPEDVDRYTDLRYGQFPENLLDVYCPPLSASTAAAGSTVTRNFTPTTACDLPNGASPW